jgi:hypothetical protein
MVTDWTPEKIADVLIESLIEVSEEIFGKLEGDAEAAAVIREKIVAAIESYGRAEQLAEALELRGLILMMPPPLEGEDGNAYTNRLTGADKTARVPYRRFRQCSIGYHDECSDPEGKECGCPCHALDAEIRVLQKRKEESDADTQR